MKLTWRRQKRESGLAGVCQGTRGYELWADGKTIIAHVAPLYKGWTREQIGWYWYGEGKNTCDSPCADADEAKRQVREYLASRPA